MRQPCRRWIETEGEREQLPTSPSQGMLSIRHRTHLWCASRRWRGDGQARIALRATTMHAGLRADQLADVPLTYAPHSAAQGRRQHARLHRREPHPMIGSSERVLQISPRVTRRVGLIDHATTLSPAAGAFLAIVHDRRAGGAAPGRPTPSVPRRHAPNNLIGVAS
jgi:hypothetical protein